ncbi:ABC transporter permease [Thalassobacillus sp. CUG 92003]|uniref:ABC transporter permease n=1 Tax=Thalassobacillus sp. CUG 92003 TaxID=2736641 RepID=UPI0015E67E5B|nr:ABC transporter permease [Thalassobacillus sp. CUG 92003]
MSAKTILQQRLTTEFRFQLNVLRSVVDWVVLLYIVVPFLTLAAFFYVDAWQNVSLYWSDSIPFFALLIVLLILSVGGNFRTHLLEADVIFLIHLKSVYYKLKQYSFLVSAIKIGFSMALKIMCLAPILVHIYDFSMLDTSILALEASMFQFLVMTIRRIYRNTYVRGLMISGAAVSVVLLVLFVPSVPGLFVSLVGLGIICYYHAFVMTRTTSRFYEEVAIEDYERFRYIRLILAYSTEVEKSGGKQASHPAFVFRRSSPIFKTPSKENGLTTLVLKAFLRNKSMVSMYAQLMGLTIGAIMITPLWYKWLVLIGFSFFMNSWLKATFTKLLSNPFFHVVPYDKQITDPVWAQFKKMIYLSSFFVMAIVAIVSTMLSL